MLANTQYPLPTSHLDDRLPTVYKRAAMDLSHGCGGQRLLVNIGEKFQWGAPKLAPESLAHFRVR